MGDISSRLPKWSTRKPSLIFAILFFRQYLLSNLGTMFESISVSKEVINKVKQCTCKCNKAFGQPLLPWESNRWVFSLSYPACNSRASYYFAIRGRCSSTLFLHIISKRHGFRKMNIEHKMIWFSLHRLSDTFLILRGNERYDHKYVLVFM